MCDPNQLAPPVAFFHLAVDQACRYLPPAHFPPSPTHLEPVSKMSRQCVEVEIEPVTGEKRETAMSQEVSQGVDKQRGHVLGAGTQLEHGQNFGARINGQPQKDAPGWSCAAWFAVRPTADAGAGGC